MNSNAELSKPLYTLGPRFLWLEKWCWTNTSLSGNLCLKR